ncbi:D-alanyl-D-alanine carboxypeptidase family protein [Bacillus massiliigorillae]|uniref:D-alanyl-D-alanine carboxypeptidase family protein n=1 Tax=Bacillus massiliigorillae TaxID=1243664 RepID=UPI000693368A|nr:D-alanyl-D-alanine carboxypeptidase family protein [Bacillus massiliigorillae]
MKRTGKVFILFIILITGVWGWNTYGKSLDLQGLTQTSPSKMKQAEGVHIQNLGLTGSVALLIDDRDGTILYDKNANKRIYPASTTKILTTLLALKYGDLNEEMTIGDEVNAKVKGESTAYLMEGSTYTLREILAGLMLPSGNDAARTIAVNIGKKIAGDEGLSQQKATAAFVDEMNRYAKKLGANHSHFVNSNGLHNRNHYTTAYDMALITQAAMKMEGFMDIVSQSSYRDKSVTFKNTNMLLDPDNEHYFEGVDGIKTGFTDEAGRCLISSIKVDGRHLIALVFDSTKEDIFQDSTALLNAGINYGG